MATSRRVPSPMRAARGAPGVQDQQHAPVALRPPGTDHHVVGTRRRPPVDGAHVVADRRTRAASRTRCPGPRTRTAVRPSSSRSRASREGRCWREANGGSVRTCQGTACEACRPASPSGPERAHGDALRPDGRRAGWAAATLRRRTVPPGGDVQPVARHRDPGRRHPGVAQDAADPARARHRDRQHHHGLLAEPDPGVTGPRQGQRGGGCRPAPRRRWPAASAACASTSDRGHRRRGQRPRPPPPAATASEPSGDDHVVRPGLGVSGGPARWPARRRGPRPR